ncbi:trypsin-like peptidase domain-containing protein [Actinomycetospora termitidis]|uniref:Serine protease n=1 Tax=Actinomycetospora termitidis TaxID=3053470 RepID=A0ABT7ME11_9PSEU|nr:serine protease [Actinomycetospora sp. Odt1-22]MDL5158903.1 serine protease [Actinomycetospora sp. Odt1-22]
MTEADGAAAVVRVRAGGRHVAGAGVLLAPDLVATCAHVVGDALGHDEVPSLAPGAALRVDLPFAPGAPARDATVWRWWPPAADGSGDVAILRLAAPVPVAVPAMRRVADLWGRSCRVAGFPPGREDGVWSGGVLRSGQGAGWIQLVGSADVGPGFSGTPVWDEGGGVIALAVAADRAGGTERSTYAIPIGHVLSQVPELLANPYRGLAAFGESDRDLFFGRETELAHATGVLEREGLVVLAGGSGTGKSSLLAAGIVPEARARGRRPAPTRLAGVSTRGEVVAAFAAALVEATAPDPAAVTRRGVRPVVEDWDARTWSRLLAARPDDVTAIGRDDERPGAVRGTDAAAVARAGLMVVVDQFEDLAASAPVAARTAVDVISTLASLGVWVAVTARWATIDDLLDGRGAPTLHRAVVGVLPPGRERLRAAVAEPAARVPGPSFAPRVVARIVDDAGDEPGRLPLVAVLLAELWDAAEDGWLTLDAYRRVGTVQGALATAAERLWDELGDGRRARARTLLLAMTRPDDTGFVRHPVPLTSLDAGQRRVAEALAAARLVVIGPGPHGDVVELAHQSLIERWPRLRGWLESDGEFLRWRAQLRHAVRGWEPGHDRDTVLRGVPLEVAASWLDERADELSAPEIDFVRAGLRRRRLERRLQRATLVAVVVLGVLLGIVLASTLGTPVSAWCRAVAPTVVGTAQWGGSVPTS